MKQPKKISQIVLFKQLWVYSDKKSFISDINLLKYMGGKFELNLFAHVLSKKQYPHFRLYLGAIKLLTPFEHHLRDHSSKEKRKAYKRTMAEKFIDVKWEKWDKEEERLKALYEEKFPKEKHGMIMKYTEEEAWEVVSKMNDEWLEENRN
jgi:hypothetical protein